MVRVVVVAVCILVFCGCTPRIQVLPDEARELAFLKERKEEIFKAGLEEGRRLCRQEFLENLAAEIDKLKGIVAYEEMYKGGYLVPPLVLPVLVRGGVSNDGKTLSLPHIEWNIIEEAHFTTDDIVTMLLKRKGFVFFGTFTSFTEAETFAQRIKLKKGDRVRYLKVKGTDEVAVVVETTPKRALEYADTYGAVVLNR